MNKIIEIRNLSKSFTNKNSVVTTVLNELNLDIYENEFVALMGPSGAGKSTLLYLLGLLDSSDNGEIAFNVNNNFVYPNTFSDKQLSDFRNTEIGFIFQFYHLLPEFTAIENVMIPAIIAGKTNKDAKNLGTELIEKVGLIDRINNKPNELSGGEQQRIAIARALINKPRIILADEPTGNLDSKNAEIVVNLLHQIKKDYQITMLMATHSNEIAKSTDRIFHLKDGKIFNIETN